jgi:hypothetical protein
MFAFTVLWSQINVSLFLSLFSYGVLIIVELQPIYTSQRTLHCCNHRLSINRPTKRGKENSRSDGHYQCEKEMEDHLLACQ